MKATQDHRVLDALLDSWDRNNTVLLNLLRAIPDAGLDARAMEGSPTVAEMFNHMHHKRMVSVFENARECAAGCPITNADAGPVTWGRLEGSVDRRKQERRPCRVRPQLNSALGSRLLSPATQGRSEAYGAGSVYGWQSLAQSSAAKQALL